MIRYNLPGKEPCCTLIRLERPVKNRSSPKVILQIDNNPSGRGGSMKTKTNQIISSFLTATMFLLAIGTASAQAATPAQWAIAGGGYFNSNIGRLYLVSNSGDNGTFAHAMFDISTQGARTLANNLRVSSVNFENGNLTIRGVVSLKRSDAPIVITVTKGRTQDHAIFNAVISPAAGSAIKIAGQLTGYLYLFAR